MIGERMVLEKFCEVVGDVFPKQPGVREGEFQFEQCFNHREFWDNLCNIKTIDVETIVLPFLNKWRCRLSRTCVSNLSLALQSTEQLLGPLRKLNIEDLDTLGAIQNTSSGTNQFSCIENAFKNIQEVKAGRRSVGFTATSKILHMAIPELFVMCDAAIRDKYGCADNAAGYINFVFRMSLIARDLVAQANGNRQTILTCSRWQRRTLAHLMDNYNYTMFTLGKQGL